MTELEGVLQPLAGEGGVDAGHQLLGQVAVVAQDGGKVQGRAKVVLVAVDGHVEEAALANDAGQRQSAGVAEGQLQIFGTETSDMLDCAHTMRKNYEHADLARVGGVGESAEEGVDEAGDLDAALIGQLLGELVENGAFGLGLHDLGDGGHAQLGELLLVLVHGHEDLLDLAGHHRAQLTQGVDGLRADDGLVGGVQAGVLDDLLEVEHGHVDTGVGQRLQGQDLLVLGLRLLEHLDQILKARSCFIPVRIWEKSKLEKK